MYLFPILPFLVMIVIIGSCPLLTVNIIMIMRIIMSLFSKRIKEINIRNG